MPRKKSMLKLQHCADTPHGIAEPSEQKQPSVFIREQNRGPAAKRKFIVTSPLIEMLVALPEVGLEPTATRLKA